VTSGLRIEKVRWTAMASWSLVGLLRESAAAYSRAPPGRQGAGAVD
jgi:hypothetical protein